MQITINGKTIEVSEQENNLLRATASTDLAEATNMRAAFAQVVAGAWKSGILEPDTLGNIYDKIVLPRGSDAKFPLDLYSPTNQGQYKAFIMPKEGAIPDQAVEGDEVFVPTFKIANSISWNLDYARDARWDIISRCIEVFTNGFVQRMNDDGWHVVLAAAATNAVINDAAAAAGFFTIRLLVNLQTAIKRLTGGRNSIVTDVYLSPEAMGDIRALSAFTVDNSDDAVLRADDVTTRALLFNSGENVPQIYGVNFHELQELGVSQEYQTYLVSTLGASLAAGSDDEFCVALDLRNRDSFVNPIREDMSMYDDPTLHRSARAGVYGWAEMGFAALDTRRALLGSM